MKNSKKIFLVNYLIMISIASQVAAVEPGRDGEKKGKDSGARVFRFETKYYTWTNLHHDLLSMESQDVRNHLVSWDVALRKQLFENIYTYYSAAAPGEFSDTKEIRKPVIYNTMSRIDRHYRKLMRAGALDSIQISEQLCSMFDKAIILYYYDTEEFEDNLRRNKSLDNKILAFNRVEILDPPAH